jgi:DNA end-binding protein Ku
VRRLLQLAIVGVLIAAAWAVLRELLERPSAASATDQTGSAPSAGAHTGEGDGVGSASKADLYRRAQKLDIPGRSKMSKDELAAAVAAARRGPSA